MYPQNFRRKTLYSRCAILAITTAFFIAAFVLNITSNQALYNFNLHKVPILQNNHALGSKAFITFMNIISNIFNPVVCAGYILIFYLVSYRKLEILCFLIWFIFLSWVLSILKMAIHQARPYWISSSGIKMLQWTCYTQFGCPSGHAMMGIVLLEFIVRFFARVHRCVNKYIGLFYLLILVLQLLVMFSRVILGMHSINQVLFGLMIGVYVSVPYYLFIEGALIRTGIKLFNNPRSVPAALILFACMLVFWAIELLVALLPAYINDDEYWAVIESINDCSKSAYYKSFQYKCLEDCGLIMAGFGILMGFSFTHKPFNMAKMLTYTRISLKYLLRFVLTIVISLIPLAIFMNPGWADIKTSTQGKALIIWACQNLGFFFGTFFLVVVVPIFCQFLNLEDFKHPESYLEFRRFEIIAIADYGDLEVVSPTRKDTEMVQPRYISSV